MKSLLCYFKGYKKECVLGPLFKLLEASFELLSPLVVKAIIDVGIAGEDAEGVMTAVELLGTVAKDENYKIEGKTVVIGIEQTDCRQ